MRPAILALLLAGACAPAASVPAGQGTAQTVSTPVVRTATTIAGQPLRLPPPPAELVAAATRVPPGGRIPVHRHPWTRIVYVEQGTIRVINRDSGETRQFERGQVFAEAVGQWHEGLSVGSEGARLVVIDLVPPGVTNLVRR